MRVSQNLSVVNQTIKKNYDLQLKIPDLFSENHISWMQPVQKEKKHVYTMYLFICLFFKMFIYTGYSVSVKNTVLYIQNIRIFFLLNSNRFSGIICQGLQTIFF